MTDLNVVFLAPGRLGWLDDTRRRTISFAAGEPVPRMGECVVLAFEAGARRWMVEDVAHIFGDAGHEIAVRLTWGADHAYEAVSSDYRMELLPPHINGSMQIGPVPPGS
ncbi:hypothetical protein G3T14_23000 [Methylobacterium sp. BTF04]|uniref:hypothetical protein n=1 Tax=Methylobacterium sp. BTF04 TaxID=2708300 RepID=UPI0013D19F59|nr:hypothetical protein [Methylobacterium sp. BTF04]NEU14922.1 hypothetical protein [Methylobacterium sp. BTF04]